MFKSFPVYLRIFGLTALLLLMAYVSQAWYNRNNAAVFQWTEEPRLTDMQGRKITTVKPGQSVIMIYSVERYPSRCWATYTEMLNGPVMVQFAEAKSMVLSGPTVQFKINRIIHIPDDLPPGTYKWSQIVVPTCNGEHSDPYRLETGITITVV